MNAIEVRNAVKCCGPEIILANFNMIVKRGSIYALMAKSGGGKSTLLSCIVGTKTLDSGVITVVNEAVGKHKSKIGYMPQEASLVEEFTICELINFFGTLVGLSRKQIRDRLNFLLDLLELPDEKSTIMNCSGGEKRRISLAVCLIHEPEILILDEPSVGLDPMLRCKIWNFFKSIAKIRRTTVLITTHYIEEAKKADCVGLLRNGALIAEDSPMNLLAKLETESLEVAFLKLCEKQDCKNFNENQLTKSDSHVTRFVEQNLERQAKSTSTRMLKIKALTMKNFRQIIRRPTVLGFLLITPFLCLVSFYLTIGSNPIGLKIGIINNEIKNFTECLDPLLKMTTTDRFTCRLSKISCRFVNSINDSIATKIFYKNFSDAYQDVKHGKIVGLIYIPINFTSSMRPLNEWENLLENYSSNGEIQVFLDQSDRQITFFLKQKLYDSFNEFIEELMHDCGKSRKVGSPPVQINTMFGSMKDEMRRSMTPGIIITLYFFLASILTSGSFVSDRLDGIWNRVLLAGVQPLDILLSHIITNSSVMILQSLEFYVVTKYIYELKNVGADWIVMLLIILVGLAAILYGLAISILAKDYMTATFASSLIFYPMMIMCGIFWPIEAIPWYLRYLAYCLPFTLPTIALRNILYKGFTFHDTSVQAGFAVVTLWILISLATSYFGLRKRKYL